MNKFSTSNEAIIRVSEPYILLISSQKAYELYTEYWLVVKSARTSTRYLAILKAGVLYAANIGLNRNFVAKSILWILGNP